MHFPQFQLVFIICASTAVYSLPASLVSNSVLLTSGQAAQALNSQFQTLTTSSPCGNLTTGCVSNSIATCKNDTWAASNVCSKSQSCFAIPNVRNGGTSLSCTSSSSGGTKSKTATANSASITSASPTATATGTGSGSQDRVTVTVTLTQPVDISATTRTVSPQEASSILSSIIAEGGQATVSSQDSEAESTPCPTMTGMMHIKTKTGMTSVPTPTTAAIDDLPTANVGPGTTITLVAATSAGRSAPSAATPTTAATSASESSSGSSYSGY
ncbi:hypothetical protein BJ912DRAFT_945270 [Pholiota molesta]|nr:hypothetical protein BJ912DRAFT_945270 [Pholiota molesta]